MSDIQLRWYQREFISNIWQHFNQGSRAPLGVLPTGGGKSICSGTIMRGVAQKGLRPAVVAHRQEIIAQLAYALATLGQWHHIIAPPSTISAAVKMQRERLGRSFYNAEAPAGVGSVQTMSRREGKYIPYDFLNLDEAHHAVAGQWKQLLAYHPNAWVLGKTATPQRLDGKGLGRHAGGPFTSMVEGPSTADLIEWGFLKRPRVYAPGEQLDFKDVATSSDGDWRKSDLASKLNKPSITGDAIAHYKRLCNGMPGVGFCVDIDHAEHVAALFCAAGIRAATMDGTMDPHLRDARRRALENGSLDLLFTVDIVSEGFDLPRVACGIMLRPTKSLALWRQQGGRMLRPYPGMEYAYILDHVGNSLRHGLLDDPIQWSLDGVRRRKKAGADSGPSVRLCRGCYAVYPAYRSACPECGELPETAGRMIEYRDGELVEVQRREQQAQFRREQGMAKTRDELIAVGERRRMDNPEAWADYVLRSRKQQPKVPQPAEPEGGTLI